MSNQPNDTTTTTMMAGNGPSRCNAHDFETDDVEEWNEHCKDHTETGVVQCNKCKIDIPFQHIPYQKQGVRGKDIQIRCAKCKEDDNNLNSLILSQQQGQQGEEGQNNLNVPPHVKKAHQRESSGDIEQ